MRWFCQLGSEPELGLELEDPIPCSSCYITCVITWRVECITAGGGEQHTHRMICVTGLIFVEGRMMSGKGQCLIKMLLLGDLELLQSDARKLAEEQFGEASRLVAQFIRSPDLLPFYHRLGYHTAQC